MRAKPLVDGIEFGYMRLRTGMEKSERAELIATSDISEYPELCEGKEDPE